jgi:signal transduction histidine kinase
VSQAWRRVLSALALLAIVSWIAARATPGRVAVGASLLRLALWRLGAPFPAPDAVVAGPDVFSSALLGPLSRSPLDLLLTAAWLLSLAGCLLARVLRAAPAALGALRALVADLLTLPLLALAFHGLAEIARSSSVPLESLSPRPAGLVPAVLQAAALSWVAAVAVAIAALHAWAAPAPASLPARGVRLALGALLLTWAVNLGSRTGLDLPLGPIVALAAGGVSAGLVARRLVARTAGRPDLAVGSLAAAAAGLAALIGISLAHYGERNLRARIEHELAPVVLAQPEWRRSVLAEAQRRADAFEILEEALPGSRPPQLEELAFAVWSGTELAAAGLPSAIEIQDAAGAPVSRFALSLPTPPLPARLPESDEWTVTRDRLPLASAERFALHAQRRLLYHGEVHGALHVYVADDLLALPVAGSQDPYSVLFRNEASALRGDAVELLAWDSARALLHSTADQPPALDAALAARLRAAPAGLWSRLPLHGAAHQAFLFSDGSVTFALAYPSRSATRVAADVVEASSAGALLVLLGAGAVLSWRTLFRRETMSLPAAARAVGSRFLLRLFVAFVAVAFLPVAVLETVVRGFVAERLRREAAGQALSMAAVAKKAVEDFAFFQEGEYPADQPVTDAALVWVASLVRNDLDVFEGGRLLASSKRELYASGLLSPRVSGNVYRELVLQAAPSALQEERIGALAYRVVSVPLALRPGPPAILSIPLALREREVRSVLDDLDRSIRLASIVFLLAAAVIARTMARRISDPIAELTRATRRIAAGDLSARVAPQSRDELAALMLSFNQMASDLDRQRQDLERSNRLAAWADMARQVAHEVKNPLTPIQLAAEHLRRVFADSREDFGSVLDSCTGTILEQVRALRGIVTEFSAYARPPMPMAESVDLAAVLEAAARPYAAVLPPGVLLEVRRSTVPAVRGDRRLLERAVVNLIENALQAVGDDGRVRLGLAERQGSVEIRVEDDGAGLSPEVRERAFEPHFSTKTGGSGLGLPLVRKIAEDHGGWAGLETEAGWTRAVIRLPISDPAPSRKA